MKPINFVESCFLELKEAGWNGEGVGGPLSCVSSGGDIAILTFIGGDLYGLLVQSGDGAEMYVDQFVTWRMALDFVRAFRVS